jgi:hypothetical protein
MITMPATKKTLAVPTSHRVLVLSILVISSSPLESREATSLHTDGCKRTTTEQQPIGSSRSPVRFSESAR